MTRGRETTQEASTPTGRGLVSCRMLPLPCVECSLVAGSSFGDLPDVAGRRQARVELIFKDAD